MRHGRHSLPAGLGKEVRDELARLGGGPPSEKLADLVAGWAAAVGPLIAGNAWPARQSRDGTVIVHTSSSTWAQELTHLEATVLERLGPIAPGRLRFLVGPLPETGRESVPSVEHSVHTPSDAETARGQAIALAIEDPRLRAAVARAAALSLAGARRRRPDRPV